MQNDLIRCDIIKLCLRYDAVKSEKRVFCFHAELPPTFDRQAAIIEK